MSDKEAPDILAAACSAVGIDELDDLMNSVDQTENSTPASTLPVLSEAKQALYLAEPRPCATLDGRSATTVQSHVRPYMVSGPYAPPPRHGWELRAHSHYGNMGDVRIPNMGDVRIPNMGDVRIPNMGDVRFPNMGDVRIPNMGEVRIPNMGDVRIPNMGDVRIPMNHQRPRYAYVPSEAKEGYVGSRPPYPRPTYIGEHPRLIHNVPHKIRPQSSPHATEMHPHAAGKGVDLQPRTVSPTNLSPQRMPYPHVSHQIRQTYPSYTMQSQHPSYLQHHTNPYHPPVHSISHPRMPRSQQTQTIPHPYPVPESMKGKMIFHPPYENFDNRRNQGVPEHGQSHTGHYNDKMSPHAPRQIIRPPIPPHMKEIVQPPIPMYAVETKNPLQNSVQHKNGIFRHYIRVPVPNSFQAPNTITRVPNPNYPFFPHFVPESQAEATARKNASTNPGGFAHGDQSRVASVRHPVRIAAPVVEVSEHSKPNRSVATHGSPHQGPSIDVSRHSLSQQFRYHPSASRVIPTGTTATYTDPVTSYIPPPHLSQHYQQTADHSIVSNVQTPRNNPEYALHGEHGKREITSHVLVSSIPREEHYHSHVPHDKRTHISSIRVDKGQPLEIPYCQATNPTEKTPVSSYQNVWSSNNSISTSYVSYAQQTPPTYERSHLNLQEKQMSEKLPGSNSEKAERYGAAPTEGYPQYHSISREVSEPLHTPNQFSSSKGSVYHHPAKIFSDHVPISNAPALATNQRLPNEIRGNSEKLLPAAPVSRTTVLKGTDSGSNYSNQSDNHHQSSTWPPINLTPQRNSDGIPHETTDPGPNMYDNQSLQRNLIHQSNLHRPSEAFSAAPQYSSTSSNSVSFSKNNNPSQYHDTSRTPNVSWSHHCPSSTSTPQTPISTAAMGISSTPNTTVGCPTNAGVLRMKDENLRRECKLSPKAIFFERMRGAANQPQHEQHSAEVENSVASCQTQFSPSYQKKTIPITFPEKKRKLSETEDCLNHAGAPRPDVYTSRSPLPSQHQPCSSSGLQTMVECHTSTAVRVSPDSNTHTTLSPDTSRTEVGSGEWQKQVPQKPRRAEDPTSPDTSDAFHNRNNQITNPILDQRSNPPPPYSVACTRLQTGSIDSKYSHAEARNSPKSVRRLSIDDNVAMEMHPYEKASCSIAASETSTSSSSSSSYQWPSCSFVPNTAPPLPKKGRYDIKDDELFASTARAVTPPLCAADTKSYTVSSGIHELQSIKEIPVHEERSPHDTANTVDTKKEEFHDEPELNRPSDTKSPQPESVDPPPSDTPEKEDPGTERFVKLLRPVLTTLLSVPEAESFRPLLDEPGKLLEEMVKRGGGEPSSDGDPLQRMKKNFKLFIRQYINPETRSEWGWEDSSIDDILELLSAQAGSARDTLDTTEQTAPANEESPRCQNLSSPQSHGQENGTPDAEVLTQSKNASPSLASPDSRNCEQEFKMSDRVTPTEPTSAADQTKVTTSQENRETYRSNSPDLASQESLTRQSKEMFHFRPTADDVKRTFSKDIDGCSIKPENFIAGRTSNIVRSYATSTTDPLSPLSSGSTSASNSSLDPRSLHGGSPKTRFPTVDMSPTEITKQERVDDDEDQSTTHIDTNLSVDQVSSATENCSSC